MSLRVDIGLQQILDDQGLSQRELSRRTGVRLATIQSMCNNEVKQLTLTNLAKICEELELDIQDILKLRR
ncbi:helix-turn-helix transcriptional regulator [Paenibacillus sp. Marseille-Q4541]|uniref:helix-turn-helix domain-containing protein n=1 Tax=Paenibacillus sp. Marseille-Q4541 TaxID=2831522 RepID=UPI001BADC250|nr:helix-turn-helix transcriptional regulator [Paenibacillus sp. Marseille-Q4541]